MNATYKLGPWELDFDLSSLRHPIRYHYGSDGYVVTDGEVPGSGFVCGEGGITVPTRINGVPVTELDCMRS